MHGSHASHLMALNNLTITLLSLCSMGAFGNTEHVLKTLEKMIFYGIRFMGSLTYNILYIHSHKLTHSLALSLSIISARIPISAIKQSHLFIKIADYYKLTRSGRASTVARTSPVAWGLNIQKAEVSTYTRVFT